MYVNLDGYDGVTGTKNFVREKVMQVCVPSWYNCASAAKVF